MFLDFSSAFDTIQPTLLRGKLKEMQVDPFTSSRIINHLTNRQTSICAAEGSVGNTGAPQGTVLSPLFFTLYTSNFQVNSETCHLQKLSGDTAAVGFIRG